MTSDSRTDMHHSELYPGQAFHKNFKNGRSSGQIRLTPSQVTFISEQQNISIPLFQLRVTLGGANNRLIFLEHANYPDWSIYSSDRSLLKSAILLKQEHIAQQLAAIHRKRLTQWTIMSLGLALLISLPIMLFFSMDRITGWIAPSLPPEIEQKIGETAWKQYEIDHEIMDSKAVKEPLEAMIAPLLKSLPNRPYSFQIHVVNAEELNAFALPGGYIALNSGLILAAQSRDEVLAVLAHEMSHVIEQHGIRSIIGSAGIFITVQALFGDVSGLVGVMISAGPLLINQSYSRSFEAEADSKGYDLLVKSGIDPQGMVDFFERMAQKEQQRQQKIDKNNGMDSTIGDLVETTSSFISSHPQTQTRIKNIQSRIKKLSQHFNHSEVEFLALQQAIKNQLNRNQPKADHTEEIMHEN